MDVSKEYIKMCEKSDEIQKYGIDELKVHLCSPKMFDYIIVKNGIKIDKPIFDTKFIRDFTWLPKQDQLQDMIKWEKEGCRNLYLRFHEYNIEYDEKSEIHIPNSFEQLWLAFVMKEKYNKKWDGKEWTS